MSSYDAALVIEEAIRREITGLSLRLIRLTDEEAAFRIIDALEEAGYRIVRADAPEATSAPAP